MKRQTLKPSAVTEMHSLGLLLVYGPASNADLANAAGIAPKRLYPILYRLRRKGQAGHEAGLYFITPAGERRLAARPRPLLFEVVTATGGNPDPRDG